MKPEILKHAINVMCGVTKPDHDKLELDAYSHYSEMEMREKCADVVFDYLTSLKDNA